MVDLTSGPDPAGRPALPGWIPSEASWRDFVALLKPRVMSLVVFTGACGLIAAPTPLHPGLALIAVLAIAIAAGGAGAINMWYDRDIDAVMTRTRHRPIPRGRVMPDDALTFGIILTAASIMMMGLVTNWLASLLLALASGFYVFVYTVWLKRRTPQNIVIGGAAGAFPPMIGWAAATGSIDWTALVLFAIIFVWTPPHFWALALYRREDYAGAGIPMLPVTAGARATKRQIWLYTVALLVCSMLPAVLGVTGSIYLSAALVLGGLFGLCTLAVWREDAEGPRQPAARRLFGFSIFYLFALFAALVIDVLTIA